MPRLFRSLLSRILSRRGPAPSRRSKHHSIEALEDRKLLSTFAAIDRHVRGSAIVEHGHRAGGGAIHPDAAGAASVTYYNADSVGVPVTFWQGLRGAGAKGQYLISGTSLTHGLLFVGTIAGEGKSDFVDVPGASLSSVYGPNKLNGHGIQLVGSYRSGHPLTDPVSVHGFLFQGTTADLPSGGILPDDRLPGATYNYVHSTNGGLAVGNYDGPTGTGQLGPGKDYIYDIATGQFVTNIVYPGSTSDTAYGIWHNGGSSYTICGGYSDVSTNNMADQDQPIGQGYLVDYNSATGQFSHWTSYSDPSGSAGSTFVTHFEGISEVKKGVYTLNADSAQSGSSGNTGFASFVTVKRNPDGTFGPASWVNLSYPGSTDSLSSNAVFGNKVVGIAKGNGGFAFQAAVH